LILIRHYYFDIDYFLSLLILPLLFLFHYYFIAGYLIHFTLIFRLLIFSPFRDTLFFILFSTLLLHSHFAFHWYHYYLLAIIDIATYSKILLRLITLLRPLIDAIDIYYFHLIFAISLIIDYFIISHIDAIIYYWLAILRYFLHCCQL
jgi:hypothetical protein